MQNARQAHTASFNAEIEFIQCNADYGAYLSPVVECARKAGLKLLTY